MTTTTDQKTVEEFPALSASRIPTHALLRMQEQVSEVVAAYAEELLDQGMGSGWRFEPALVERLKKATLIAMWRLTRSIGMMGFSSPEYAPSYGVIDAAVRRLLAQDIELPQSELEHERLRND